jgi:hypothetical protein
MIDLILKIPATPSVTIDQNPAGLARNVTVHFHPGEIRIRVGLVVPYAAKVGEVSLLLPGDIDPILLRSDDTQDNIDGLPKEFLNLKPADQTQAAQLLAHLQSAVHRLG